MKRIAFILTLFLAGSFAVFSQALGWDNNRIAVSADGNNQPDNLHKWPKADPDDWGATPTTLAMLAKLKLQDKLVHYSYNNFIGAPPHTTAVNQMKIGVDGAIKYWNFDATRFFDVSANNQVAIDHLAAELAKSTATDPLYFLHMGPSEFFYRCVKKVVDEGNEEALAHVYVISHSGYNDNHLRRGDPNFDIEPVAAEDKHHTMAETIALSGNRIQYKKIKDQNSGNDPNAGWKSDSDWSVWYWMRDHKDPSVQWIYERMLSNSKNSADVSDAGLMYYLLENDEDGSPSKFQTFIGDGINEVSDAPACQDFTWVGVQDFEMAKIDTFVLPYKDTGRNAIAINAGAYKNKFAATQKIFDGKTGFYNIDLTTLTEEDGESTYRIRINDALVGEVQNPETSVDMAEHTFTFEKVFIQTGAIVQIESNTHSNGKIPEGDAYAYSRGRWRSIAFQCTEGQCDVQDVDGLLVFEAERMALQGDWKLGKDATKASGGEYVYYDGDNKYSAVDMNQVISYTFNIAEAGNYTVKWTMRQPEGERGTDTGNDVWIYLSDNIGYAANTQITEYEKFYSRSGDDFILQGVAEIHNIGHSWLTAKFPSAGQYTINFGGRSHGLQIDRVVMFKGMTMDDVDLKLKNIVETTTCGNIINTSVEKALIDGFSGKIPNKQHNIDVKVNYTTFEPRDLQCSILKPDGSVFATQKDRVEATTASRTFEFSLSEDLAIANAYKVKVDLLPVDSALDQSIYSDEVSFDVVDGDAPADKDEVLFVDVPTRISTDELVIPIKVNYSATEARDINIEVKDAVYITNSLLTVPAGTRDTSITIKFASPLAVGTGYRFILSIRPVGGGWQTNITKVESPFEVTNTSAVAEQESDASVRVYPNPCKEELIVENNGFVKQVKIYAIDGQEVLVYNVASDSNRIPVKGIDKGTYLLQLSFVDGSTQIKKIVKQ